jgi:hypothetical protein
MARIAWIESLGEGLSRARTDRKQVLVDFFNPN